MHSMSGSQQTPSLDWKQFLEWVMALGLGWTRDRLKGVDNYLINTAADRQAYHQAAAEEAAQQFLKDQYNRNLGRDAASLAPEALALLQRQQAGESEARAAARATLQSALYGKRPLPADLNEAVIAERLGLRGVGAEEVPTKPTARQQYQDIHQALVDAAMDAQQPGRFNRTLAGLNQNLVDSRAARVGMIAGIGAGGTMATMALTPAAQELLALAGFLQEGEQTAQSAADSPLNRA